MLSGSINSSPPTSSFSYTSNFVFKKNILFQLLKYKAQQISSAKNACAVKMAALFEALGLTSSANH